MSKPAGLRKDQMLAHWRSLPLHRQLRPRAVPYKHEGSTFDEDTIRITGSREFIDSVLSRLQDMLVYESATTRLQVVYGQAIDKDGRVLDSWRCYIQVHERGPEAIHMNLVYGR